MKFKRIVWISGSNTLLYKILKKPCSESSSTFGIIKKRSKWSWNDYLERAFNEIKLLFSSSVLLNYPEVRKPFYLQIDASDVALGAVLFQLDEDGNPCPIIYASRTLKGAKLAYYTTEKEL